MKYVLLFKLCSALAIEEFNLGYLVKWYGKIVMG